MRTITLADADLRVEILPELGGRIHRIAFHGFDLLRTPTDPAAAVADPFFWSGFVMAPWANRVPGAVMWTGDGPVPLPANFDDGSAIHGEVYARAWQVGHDGTMRVRGGDTGFPFRYEVTATVRVGPGSVAYSLALRNDDVRAMPAGLGWHPWFNADSGSLRLRVPASLAYRQTPDYLPVGAPRPVTDGHVDLRRDAPVPWGTHEVYTGLSESRVTLVWPARGITARLGFGGVADHLLVYASEAHDAVAVEPQTHAPDGHRRAAAGQSGGVATLPPGAELRVDYQLRLHRTPPPRTDDEQGAT